MLPPGAIRRRVSSDVRHHGAAQNPGTSCGFSHQPQTPACRMNAGLCAEAAQHAFTARRRCPHQHLGQGIGVHALRCHHADASRRTHGQAPTSMHVHAAPASLQRLPCAMTGTAGYCRVCHFDRGDGRARCTDAQLHAFGLRTMHAQIAAGIDQRLRRPGADKNLDGTVNCIAFCNAAKIQPQAATRAHTCCINQLDTAPICQLIWRFGHCRPRQHAPGHELCRHRRIEAAIAGRGHAQCDSSTRTVRGSTPTGAPTSA